MDWLRNAIKPMDLLIGLVGLYLLGWSINYDDMTMLDKVYVVCFVLWFVLLGVRCYLYYRRDNQ